MSRSDHHRSPFESIIPTAPAEPHDPCRKQNTHVKVKKKKKIQIIYDTLSGCKILRVGQVDAVESSSARFPPPSTFQHRGAVEARSVVVPFIFWIGFPFSIRIFLSFFFLRPMSKTRESCFPFFSLSLPIIRRERTQIGTVPRIVERVSSVARIAANLQLVLFPLRV